MQHGEHLSVSLETYLSHKLLSCILTNVKIKEKAMCLDINNKHVSDLHRMNTGSVNFIPLGKLARCIKTWNKTIE